MKEPENVVLKKGKLSKTYQAKYSIEEKREFDTDSNRSKILPEVTVP